MITNDITWEDVAVHPASFRDNEAKVFSGRMPWRRLLARGDSGSPSTQRLPAAVTRSKA
jgi:hypothetical protein